MTDSPPVHPAAMDPDALLRQCRLHRSRGSGPGGQRRNKVETAVQLTHEPTGIIGQANEWREPIANHRAALRRLRLKLAVQVRCPLTASEPSERWQKRVSKGRIAINPDHADLPALLAEALDVLAAWKYDVPRAAVWLGVSNSQVVKLLAIEPAVLEHFNAERARRGLHPLKPNR